MIIRNLYDTFIDFQAFNYHIFMSDDSHIFPKFELINQKNK